MLFWLIDRLKLQSDDTLWIALTATVEEEFHLASQIRKEYPNLNLKVVLLKFQTRGAAETLFIIMQQVGF